MPRADIVIVGAISEGPGVDTILASVKPDGRIIFAEPYGSSSILGGGVILPEDVTISTTNGRILLKHKKSLAGCRFASLISRP